MFEHYYNSIQQTAITLMLFMGIYLILCNVPDKKLYKQFKCARQCIGVSFVIIGLQFLAQQTLGIRHNTPILSAALNLSTFYIVLQLSAASYISLIDKTYLFKKRIIIFFSRSFVYNIYIWVCYFTVPVPYIKYLMWIAGIIFLIELNYRTWEFFNKYRLIMNKVENYYHENVDTFVKWTYKSVYGSIFCCAFASILTFSPLWIVEIYLIIIIIAYIYIFVSFQNYMIHFEKISVAVEDSETNTEATAYLIDQLNDFEKRKINKENSNTQYTEEKENELKRYLQLEAPINTWIESKGYLESGITLGTLSEQIGTNRTYLSTYINNIYKTTFRNWINNLRIEYSKELMLNNQDWTIEQVAIEVGFISNSHFGRLFTEKEEISPAEWRKRNKNSA